jgi:isopenicillin N synthase-like dioxygenase
LHILIQIPKNSIMGLSSSSFPHPPILDQYLQTLKDFTSAIHSAAAVIFSSLSTSLGLPDGQDFGSCHRLNASSPDIIRLLKYHAQPADDHGAPHIPHTDIGSLTFLFSRQPGLQFHPPGVDEWQYVIPRPDHAVINLGDGMSLFTNKLFHSCLHRVVPLPNRAMETRYSFAYMMRAENHTLMTGLKSDLIPPSESTTPALTSADWLRVKFGALRFNTFNEKQRWILTGTERNGKEPVGDIQESAVR